MFLNKNMERSINHRREIESSKVELKKLQEELDNISQKNDIVAKLQDCMDYMKQNTIN